MGSYNLEIDLGKIHAPDGKLIEPGELKDLCAITQAFGGRVVGKFVKYGIKDYDWAITNSAVNCYQNLVTDDSKRFERHKLAIKGIIKKALIFVPEQFTKEDHLPAVFNPDGHMTIFYDVVVKPLLLHEDREGKKRIVVSILERNKPLYLL